MPLEIVFLERQNWRPLRPHYLSPITAFTVFVPFVTFESLFVTLRPTQKVTFSLL